MIRLIKFFEKMWLLLAILTFIIALYWTYKQMIFDSLYFYGISILSILLFRWRRFQRRAHERENS
jgi:accessory gene regulator protein AgrB